MEDEPGGWVLKAIDKHFEVAAIEVSYDVQILILYLSKGIVGIAVKYVKDVIDFAKAMKLRKIEWFDFNARLYPVGYPDFTKD